MNCVNGIVRDGINIKRTWEWSLNVTKIWNLYCDFMKINLKFSWRIQFTHYTYTEYYEYYWNGFFPSLPPWTLHSYADRLCSRCAIQHVNLMLKEDEQRWFGGYCFINRERMLNQCVDITDNHTQNLSRKKCHLARCELNVSKTVAHKEIAMRNQ